MVQSLEMNITRGSQNERSSEILNSSQSIIDNDNSSTNYCLQLVGADIRAEGRFLFEILLTNILLAYS